MNRDRTIQLVAVLVMVVSGVACGALLPRIIDMSDEHGLRYTNESVEGAPPWVALGTAIGALRGIIVDFLWIKVHIMKEKGLFYEVMSSADLITKLQPRFAAVWAFHGHNMAYNVSVATHTLEERWEWVNAGIRLVRNEGIRHNPNDMVLHKELAFWFAHKIEGVADDAHLYYKQEFCREWHSILGAPPEAYDEHVAWIKEIADAPDTLQEAEAAAPGVLAAVEALRSAFPVEQVNFRFALDRDFLGQYAMWEAIKGRSEAARILGIEQQYRKSTYFETFDDLAGRPENAKAWRTLLAHVRKRVLLDEYNMDPQLMYEYTRDLGPLDWRHGQSHALYWARRGATYGAGRISEEDVYKVMNTDRIQLQAWQALARSGRISYDPIAAELTSQQASRFPDPRWIDVIENNWEDFYIKHYEVRGWGGDTFLSFLENFMSSAIREWYRSGERERAQALYDMLDEYFGTGAVPPSPKYSIPLEVYVQQEIEGQLEAQPHLAPSEIAASLRYGFRIGIGQGRREVFEDAVRFADQVTDFFQKNEWYDYETKFGTGRIADLIGALEDSVRIVFVQLMTDPGLEMEERMVIWSEVDKYVPQLRVKAYDFVVPSLQRQFLGSPYSVSMSFDEAFPQPQGLAEYRLMVEAQRAAAIKEREDRLGQRSDMQRK